jgi:molybdenum cofactor sulfurtransferase
VFTANATAAVKLVIEYFSRLSSGFDYFYHRSCHTSLVGARELASRAHCLATDDETEEWLDGRFQPLKTTSSNRPIDFAYSAQSNMNGQRLPLEWPQQLRESAHHPRIFTLLDVAAFVSTSPLDLSHHASAPDFTVLSFYKIFGFPDLGVLMVRRAASPILEHRKYFGGGTTETTTCYGENPWVVRNDTSIHDRLEDGTLAIRSTLALRCAIDSHRQLFGGMHEISKDTAWLGALLYVRLSALTHTNGTTVCQIYKASTSGYGDPKTQVGNVCVQHAAQ